MNGFKLCMNRALVYNAFECWDCLVMIARLDCIIGKLLFLIYVMFRRLFVLESLFIIGRWFGRIGRLELPHQLQLQ